MALDQTTTSQQQWRSRIIAGAFLSVLWLGSLYSTEANAQAERRRPITPTEQATRQHNLEGHWQCHQSRAIPDGGRLSTRFNTHYRENHQYQTRGTLTIALPQQRLTYDISAHGRWALQGHELQEDAQQHFEPSNPAARQLAQNGQFDPNREQASSSFNRYDVIRLDAETLVLRTPKPHSMIQCRRP
ncbi:hypothetical protein [Terasakiispira papahanaumokuakeensis]|uniref:hypothetical protein n=1 Tax=Terasakiispira papahanaumokuakeensis TaxID=197479 RepID=UPI001112ABD1|nr:hypothetical protein [Terasakiispira papahanaumokuakeensis]